MDDFTGHDPGSDQHSSIRFDSKPFLIFILGMAMCISLGVIWFGFESSNRFEDVNALWQSSSDEAAESMEALNALRGVIGYGGFIHNFKNYVLRREPALLVKLDLNEAAFEAAMARLTDRLRDPDDVANLAVIEETFLEYIEKRRLAARLPTNVSAEQLDELVRVDDGPALAAFEQLFQAVYDWQEQEQTQAHQKFQSASEFLSYGSYILVIVGVTVLGVVVVLNRLMQAKLFLENAQSQLNTLLLAVPNPMLCANEAGDIIRVNDAAMDLLGYDAKTLTKMKVEDLIPERYRAGHQHYRKEAFARQTDRAMGAVSPLIAVTQSGEERALDISLNYCALGDERVVVVSMHDITERNAAESQMAKAQQDAEAASRAKSQFLAIMSHELRTPLNAIIGFSDMMRLKMLNPVKTDDCLGYVNHIQDSSHNLLSMINEILDMSMILAGDYKVKLEPVDVTEIIRDLVLVYGAAFDRKGITLSVRADTSVQTQAVSGGGSARLADNTHMPVLADRESLRQVVQSLLDNALHFTPVGGQVRLALYSDGRRCGCAISDTGPGMSVQDQKRAVDTFVQLNRERQSDQRGTGLGLPLSNALMELMNGELVIQSAPGEGTTITIWLPEVEAEHAGMKDPRLSA